MKRRAWQRVGFSILVSVAAGFACGDIQLESDDVTLEPLADAGAGPDATVVDASSIKPDTSNAPEPGCSGICIGCGEPNSLENFAPSWKAPNPLASGQCSAAQVETWIRCQLDSSQDAGACKAFAGDKANADCAKCIFTPSSATKLGPVIELPGNLVELNVSGCVANLVGDTSSAGCGATFQAMEQCRRAACETNGPVPNGEAGQECGALCEQNALDAGVCKRFASGAGCITPLIADGGVAATCARTNDFTEDAVRLAELFCVAALDGGDAGAESDGSDD